MTEDYEQNRERSEPLDVIAMSELGLSAGRRARPVPSTGPVRDKSKVDGGDPTADRARVGLRLGCRLRWSRPEHSHRLRVVTGAREGVQARREHRDAGVQKRAFAVRIAPTV